MTTSNPGPAGYLTPEPADSVPGSRSTGPVGRARDLATLIEGIRRSIDGEPEAFLVSGRAGVGKTMLVTEAAGEAKRLGAAVLWGRCWEEGTAPPFWPWLEILRQARDIGGIAEEDRRPARDLVAEIERGTDSAHGGALEAAGIARFRLYDRISRFLVAASQAGPLVLVIDDVQSADEASLHLLHFLLRGRAGRRIAVLLTRRDPERRPLGDDLAAVLASVVRETTPMLLEGLSEADSGILLEQHAGRRMHPGFVRAAWEKTGGNPLFLTLLGQAVRTDPEWNLDGAGEGSAPRLPSEVRDLVSRRVRQLGPAARSMIELAAIIGEQVDLPLLLRASRATGAQAISPDAAVTRGIEEWSEIEASGIVEESGAPSSWRFVHGIVRDAILGSIPAAERMRLHGVVADACESLDPLLELRLEQAAHHRAIAAPLDPSGRAVELLVRAGRQAIRRLAHERAASILARALDLARESGDTRRTGEILVLLGESQLRGTAIVEAQRSLEEAVGLARSTGDSEGLGRAALLLADVGTGLPLDSSREGKTGLILLEALDALGPEDSPLRASLLTRSSSLLFEHRPVEERARLAADGLEMARRLGDPSLLGHALCDVHAALWDPANTVERLGWSSEALGLARVAGDDALALRASVSRILALFELGDPIAFDVEIPQLDGVARRIGEPRYLWLATHLRALEALVRGRFAEAEQFALDALAHGERARDPRAQSFVALVFEVLRFLQGRLAEFEPMIRANVFDGDDISMRLGIGLLAAELGRPDEARAVLDSLRHSGRVEMGGDPRALTVMAGALAQTVVFLGDAEAARSVHGMLAPHDGRFVTAQHLGTMVDAPVAFYLATLEATFGDMEAAERHFRASLASCDRLKSPPARARTLLAFGRMLAARGAPGDARRARPLLEESSAIASDLGMVLVGERAAAALASLAELRGVPAGTGRDLGEGSRPSGQGSAKARTAIFRRRGEVWEVAFDGREALHPHVRGFDMLAVLLSRPRVPVTCEELQAIARGVEIRGSGLREGRIDAAALADYRRRLADLRSDLESATKQNDTGRRETIETEIDFLEAELGRSLGLVGRPRSVADAERARVNVRRAIALALSRLATHEELSAHLDRSISTGATCTYDPSDDMTIEWLV